VVKKAAPAAPANAAAASFTPDYTAETFTVGDDYEVSSTNGDAGVITNGSLTGALNGTGKVYIRVKETADTNAGEWLEVTLPSRPTAPTGLGSTNATNGSTTDGTITGVDTTMEYSADGTTWTAVTGSPITGLTPGTYSVRVKATGAAPHGAATEVTVGSDYTALTEANKPTVTVSESHNPPVVGDTLTASTTATDVIYEWYRNGVKIDGATAGTYTLTAVDVGKTITVKAIQTKQPNGSDYAEADRPTQTSAPTAAVVKKDNPTAPTAVDASKVSKNGTSITIDPTSNKNEYIVVPKGTVPTDSDWTSKGKPGGDPVTFDGLTPSTEYDIFVRTKETSSSKPSPNASPTTVTTSAYAVVITPSQPKVGAPLTATITPAKDGVTYEWYADGAPIAGATGGTYTPTDGDKGKTITVIVKDGGMPICEKTADAPVTEGDKKTVNGTVYSSTGAPVYGAEVKLMQGNVRIGNPVTTDANGRYSFTVDPGNYNIVATHNSVTKTELVELTASKSCNLHMPSGATNSLLDVKPNTPSVLVGGLDDEAETVKAEEDGGNTTTVTVKMTVEEKAENAAVAAEVTAIKEQASGQTLAYIEIKVEKTVNTTTTPMTETSKVLEIVVPYSFADKTSVTVYRYHDGIATKLTQNTTHADGTFWLDTANGFIYIYTKLFSTYAIGASDIHTVTVTNDGNGTGSASPASGTNGTAVTLTATPNDGYHFKEWQLVSGNGTLSGNTYTIGTDDATIKAVFEANPPATYSVTVNYGTSNKATAAAGESVTITANAAPSGKVFDKWVTTSPGVNFTNASSATTTFVMPANNVTVTATYKAASSPAPYYPSHDPAPTAYAIQTEKAEHGTVKTSYEKTSSGTKVTITATPETGYEVGSVTVTDANGNNVKVTKNADGTYSFTMPASKVTVKVTFVPVAQQQACPLDSTCPISRFTDADATAWYHDGVHWALENGVMQGVSPKMFEPNGTTTRAQIATMLYRLAGSPATSGENVFADVAEGMWYTEAIRWAASVGVVTGFERDGATVFDPDAAVTREQFAAMLYRYAKLNGQGFTGAWMFLLDYPDAGEVSEWADEAMHWMVMQGIINGVDGKLVPQGDASRAQVATMLMRFCTETAM